MFNLDNIRIAIANLHRRGIQITTIKIIEILNGYYQIDHGMTPSQSPNAHYGKFLRKNENALGIKKCDSINITINGKRTTTAVWS